MTEQECLATVLSIKKYKPCVEEQEFTIVTDHEFLKWLMCQRQDKR